ncbi:hypothetical protein ACMHYB_43920 [Sorangium sp. So ce1128]
MAGSNDTSGSGGAGPWAPRRSRPGRVDLVISSHIEQPVVIAGLTSCNDSSQCPEGKTCQSALTYQ